MAFFVFFSAAAGAGVVSADFGFVELDGFDFLFWLSSLAGFVLGGELFKPGVLGVGDVPDTLAIFALANFNFEDNISDLFSDVAQHFLEHPEAFLLVFYFWIFLGESPQAYSALEMIHRVEMFLPGRVVNLQKDISFQFCQFAAQKLTGAVLNL